MKEHAAQDARLHLIKPSKGQLRPGMLVWITQREINITFIDADDYVKENYLERLVTEYQAAAAEIAISDYYRYKEQTNMLYSYRAKEDYQVVDLALAELLQQMNKLEFTTVWGKLFQRTLFERGMAMKIR